jgi:hypothetical protein
MKDPADEGRERVNGPQPEGPMVRVDEEAGTVTEVKRSDMGVPRIAVSKPHGLAAVQRTQGTTIPGVDPMVEAMRKIGDARMAKMIRYLSDFPPPRDAVVMRNACKAAGGWCDEKRCPAWNGSTCLGNYLQAVGLIPDQRPMTKDEWAARVKAEGLEGKVLIDYCDRKWPGYMSNVRAAISGGGYE